MAKTSYTHVTDDIDGTADAQPVTFDFQGVAYSIDLSQNNLDKLTKALAPFIERAVKQKASGASPKRNAQARRPYNVPALRDWAAKQKIDLPQRGRIPSAVVAQYQAAGGH